VKLALGGAIAVIAVSVVAAVGYPAHVVAALAILAAAGLAELIAKTVHATFQGVEDMAPAARGLALQRITTALIGIAALLAGAGVVVAALTYLAGAVVALAYVSAGLIRRVARPLLKVSLPAARRLLASSWPVGATVVLGAAVARLDVVLLSALKDNVAVGLYSAAFRPYEALYFLSWSFGLAALPALSRLTRNSEPPLRRAFEVGMKVMALALFPVGCMFALFAETILTVLYGDAYATAAPALRFLGVSIALSGLATLATQLLVSQERVKVTLPVSVAALGVNAALNLLLIPPYSFEGAAAAMAATTLTFSGLLVALAGRVTGRLRWHRVLASPVGACLVMAIVVLGLGTGVVALIVAFAVAAPIAVLIERRLFPDDYRLLRHSLSVRHARERTAV
jgi:O-antigen/teichoic acid export membrane protein